MENNTKHLASLKIKITTQNALIVNHEFIDITNGDTDITDEDFKKLIRKNLVTDVIYEIPVTETQSIKVSKSNQYDTKLKIHNFNAQIHQIDNNRVYNLLYIKYNDSGDKNYKKYDEILNVSDIFRNNDFSFNLKDESKTIGLLNETTYQILLNGGFEYQHKVEINELTKQKLVIFDLSTQTNFNDKKVLLKFVNSLVQFNVLISLSNEKLEIVKKDVVFSNNLQLFNNENNIVLEIFKNSTKLLVNCDFSRLGIKGSWQILTYINVPKIIFPNTFSLNPGEFEDSHKLDFNVSFPINSCETNIFQYNFESNTSSNSVYNNNILQFDLTKAKHFSFDDYLPKFKVNYYRRYISDLTKNAEEYGEFFVGVAVDLWNENSYPELLVTSNSQKLFIFDKSTFKITGIFERYFVQSSDTLIEGEWRRIDVTDIKTISETEERQFIDKLSKDRLHKLIEYDHPDFEYPRIKVHKIQITEGNRNELLLGDGTTTPINQLRSHIIRIPKNTQGGGLVDYRLQLSQDVIDKLGNFVHVSVFEKTGEE